MIILGAMGMPCSRLSAAVGRGGAHRIDDRRGERCGSLGRAPSISLFVPPLRTNPADASSSSCSCHGDGVAASAAGVGDGTSAAGAGDGTSAAGAGDGIAYQSSSMLFV